MHEFDIIEFLCIVDGYFAIYVFDERVCLAVEEGLDCLALLVDGG